LDFGVLATEKESVFPCSFPDATSRDYSIANLELSIAVKNEPFSQGGSEWVSVLVVR